MDDQTAATVTRVALSVAAFLVLLVLGRAVLGEPGVTLVLLLAMVAVSVFAYGQLTGRPPPRLARPARSAAVEPPVAEDVWRSERWVAEAVERGLRAIDEWRLEQREA